jgi:putative aldouronate transport system substrate-binding protein
MFASMRIMATGRSEAVQELSQRTGIKMKPIQVDPSAYPAKLNAMIAAKTIPDIFLITPMQFEEFARNGIIVPLDEYLPEYGTNILRDKKDLLKNAVMDGKTWYIPLGYYFSAPMSAVRQDWIRNMGLKAPTTLDELHDVLMAFMRNDPNKDGKDNTVGLGASLAVGAGWREIFPAFGISNLYGNYIDGKWTPYLLHPRYLRRLCSGGLMEPDFATIQAMQCHEKLWSGIYGAYVYWSLSIPMNTIQMRPTARRRRTPMRLPRPMWSTARSSTRLRLPTRSMANF